MAARTRKGYVVKMVKELPLNDPQRTWLVSEALMHGWLSQRQLANIAAAKESK